MNEFKRKLYEDYQKYKENVKKVNITGNKKPKYYKMYDEDGEYIGWINTKYEKMQNRYLKGVSTFVITDKGEVIIEIRSKDCILTPNQRDLCSGHIDQEEQNDETVYRELKEELGIQKEQIYIFSKNINEIPLIFARNRKFFIQFNTVIGNFDVEQIRKHIQSTEVADVISIPLQDCFELIRSNRTKFPYAGNEERFEEVFQSVIQTYQNFKKENNIGER